MQWARVLRAGAAAAGNRADGPLTTGGLAEVLSVMGHCALRIHQGTAVDGHPQLERPYSDTYPFFPAEQVCVKALPITASDSGLTIDVPPGWHLVQVLPHLDAPCDDMIMCLIETAGAETAAC
jgi:hypothetical protein